MTLSADNGNNRLESRLTRAQSDALARAEQHPRRHVVADPRVVRALLDRGLVHIGYYGESADGADYGPILGPVDEPPMTDCHE